MRCIITSIGLAALACLHLTEAFAPSAIKRSVSLSVAKTEEPCAIPSDFQDALTSLVNVPNSFKSIRSGMVTSSAGELIRLGDVISKNEPHVVIFLRHMGWPYCWSYAKEWTTSLDVQQQLLEAGIKGPTFVSIGDADKLNVFLDANPWIDSNQMFVDDYSFGLYKEAGFTRFDQVDKEKAKSVKMTAPDLKFGEWMSYFNTVGKVSPSKFFVELLHRLHTANCLCVM